MTAAGLPLSIRICRPLCSATGAVSKLIRANQECRLPSRGSIVVLGRDATDVAILTSFGPCTMAGFKVITEEVMSTAA
jgi:hypothetical protein